MPQPTLEFAQQVMDAQPFSTLLGARLIGFGDGEAVVELDIADHHRQQFGLVHGGVLAYCADNALTFAAGTVLGASILTTGMTITYLRPARDGTLRTKAVVETHDDLVATCTAQIEVLGPDRTLTLCAIAEGTARIARAAR
ncbi:MAG TPA: PaaI family thioesterase [Micromonospora sp.]